MPSILSRNPGSQSYPTPPYATDSLPEFAEHTSLCDVLASSPKSAEKTFPHSVGRPWSVLSPETMLMSMVMTVSMSVLWPRTVLMSLVCAATRNHIEVCGPCCPWRPCGCLCYHPRLCGPLWSMPPNALLTSMGHAASRGHVDVHGLSCCQGT